MAHFTLLDQAAEDKLHSTRLLNIEERPFKRITKRLLAPSTPIAIYLSRTPKDAYPPGPSAATNPTQNASSEPASDVDLTASTPTALTADQQAKFLKDLQRFRDDTILDFAAFDSSIARIQFLHLANEKQRQRYTEEKSKIQSTSENVREDMERLKTRLEEAQRTLQVRKGYDLLAEQITRNKDLKTRDEQQVNIERLRAEIEELEREGVELSHAWVERREQFGRVLDEGARLKRVVRGEPEPDPEGKADGEDEEEENEREHDGDERSDVGGDENMLEVEEGQRDHDDVSNRGTPMMRPVGEGEGEVDGDDAPTPLPGIHESETAIPRNPVQHLDAVAEISTPQPDAHVDEKHELSEHDEDDVEMRDGGFVSASVPEVKVDDMDVT